MKIKHIVQINVQRNKDLLASVLSRHLEGMKEGGIIDQWSLHDSFSHPLDDSLGVSMVSEQKMVMEINFSCHSQYNTYMSHQRHKDLIHDLDNNSLIDVSNISNLIRTIDYHFN